MWEYKAIQIRFSHEAPELERMGRANWELVAVSNGRFYFKRPASKEFKVKTWSVTRGDKVIAEGLETGGNGKASSRLD